MGHPKDPSITAGYMKDEREHASLLVDEKECIYRAQGITDHRI